MNERFEEIEHTADIAIRVRGRDLAELFANGAYGMACQLADPDVVDQTAERSIELDAYDAETLLVAWLGELLYLGERDGCVFTDFDMLEVTSTWLRAVARGGPVPAGEHRSHIKAVTFNELEIVRTGEGYETTVVFDV
ncbi:MAG: archease [Chloroflexota bacterium]|nr:archease [Chloroflexota bacterium]